MMKRCCRYLSLSCGLLIVALLAGCAGQKSMVVLLPEPGKTGSEVVVVNSHGSQVLDRPWQAVEIPGKNARPAKPVVLGEAKVESIFGEILTAMPMPAAHYMLFFKLDSAELMPDSKHLLPEILMAIQERQPAELSVVGHTDTVESAEYNYQLGLLRANAVATQLKSLGAAPKYVTTTSRGKTDLLVKTGDQVLEPRNRRAEVIVR
jgi:outer membrane protein OmpA-like peptidoglycan-associated protein